MEGTITCPWHHFCDDSTTGECLTMPGAQLQQLPLRIEDGEVWSERSEVDHVKVQDNTA